MKQFSFANEVRPLAMAERTAAGKNREMALSLLILLSVVSVLPASQARSAVPEPPASNAVGAAAIALPENNRSANQQGSEQADASGLPAVDLQGRLFRAQSELAGGNYDLAADEAQRVLEHDPNSDLAMFIRVEALKRAGKKRAALAEADQFGQGAAVSPLLRSQRGFLRRELNDPRGAADDFATALMGRGLTADQRRNVEAGLTEARSAEVQGKLDRADAALKQRDYKNASQESRDALQYNPKSESAILIRIAALSRMGAKREALSEADGFIAGSTATAVLRAQRGYLRRDLNDPHGAVVDFSAALAGDGLAPEQQKNVQAALMEAHTAELEAVRLRRLQKMAARRTAVIVPRHPNSDVAIGLRFDALSRAGHKREAQYEMDRLISRGSAPAWAYAQRGFARRDAGDLQGALQDFDEALGRHDLERSSTPNIRYARADTAAVLAERGGNPQGAEASYRAFLETEPARADGWFKLGYLLLQQKKRPQGADALSRGLELRPVGTAYLDAANAYIFTNAPLASKHYREGLDRWYAGDQVLIGRSTAELERVKNEVVEADATVRTTLSYGGIAGRPEGAGGSNNSFGAETRMRFDGRYLPPIDRLEAVAHGLSGKDANSVRETDAGVGLRYRPIPNLNLSFGGTVDHFFQPVSKTEFVLNWGLGVGSDAYPYMTSWTPYWDFGTFGAWRTSEGRVLDDTRANVGLLYALRAPFRAAIGPTILAVAGYDSLATTPWAAGIGPSVLSYFWLGGDKYRSYDSILTLQLGFLQNIGADKRQRGWRGRISLTF